MPAGIVETYADRVPSKGTKLYIYNGATWSRAIGVKSIGGISQGRDGDIDATELAPAPEPLPSGEIEEEYYRKKYLPAQKDTQALTVELNMEPNQYDDLILFYTRDTIIKIAIVFRNANALFGDCYVSQLDTDIQDNTLIQTPVSFRPVTGLTWGADPVV